MIVVWQLILLILILGIFSVILGVWISYREDIHMLKEKKKIHIYYINKIKNLDYKIIEQENTGHSNSIVVKSCQRWKKHWLDKANIVNEELRKELLSVCVSNIDNCKERLKKLGWTILEGEENL